VEDRVPPADDSAVTTPPEPSGLVEAEEGSGLREESDVAPLFEWPAEPGRQSHRQLDIEELIAVERAAAAVVEPVGRLWRQLASSADSVVSARTLDALLRDSLATMSRILSVNTVAILLANDTGDELVARAAIGLSEELTIGIGIRAGQGMAGRVLASRQPLIVRDLSEIEVVNPVLRNSGLRSVAAVPLLSGGHPLGVMYAASYELDRFGTADAELLQLVADRLAAALDRVRLFEKEREVRRAAEALAERIGRMQRVTALLAAAETAEEVAASLVDALDLPVPSWRAVWMQSEDRVVTASTSGAAPAGWESPAPLVSDHPVARAVRERREVADDAHCWVVLPVDGGAGSAAALTVVVEDPGSLQPDEQELLRAVVLQAAQAFDRVRLADEWRMAAERASFFARAAQVMAAADSLVDTLERLGDLAVANLGEICLIDVVEEDGSLRRVVAKHRDPLLQHLVDRLRAEYPPDPLGRHPAVLAIRTGQSTWSDSMPEEFLRSTTIDDDHFQLVRALNFRSYVTLPIAMGGRALGSLTSVSTSRPFRRDDVDFAVQLAQQVAAVVDSARRYEVTFRTSQILQSSLLPSELPTVRGLSVHTRYLTANRGLEVGGDFYDLVVLPSGSVLFLVGDVAGHDRAAAAQMGHLRSAARALSGHAPSPARLLAALRSAWETLGFERIATVLAGTLHPRSGDVVLASAGHYPPLLVARTGTIFLPVSPCPPLGMPGPLAREWRGTIGAGQVLLAYTDGAIDERSAGIEASMARLARVAAAGRASPLEVCERVVAVLDPDRVDDVALMALSAGN
jgi:GAF domain-containing protein